MRFLSLPILTLTLLLVMLGQAKAEPYHRPIDLLNPYQEELTYTPLDQRDYQLARRQVAEVCQDLSFALKAGRIKDPEELEALMPTCNPDDMEYDTIQVCADHGIPASLCPVNELLFAYVGMLRSIIP